MQKSKKQWDSNLTDYMAKTAIFTVDEMSDEKSRAIVAESYGFHQYKMSLALANFNRELAIEMSHGVGQIRRFVLWLRRGCK